MDWQVLSSRNILLRTSIVCLSLTLITSCSQRTAPAPVSSIEVKGERPSTSAVSGKTYKVQSGETLYSIAWRANMDFRTLADINNISSPYLIRSGQTLHLVKTKQTSYAKTDSSYRSKDIQKPVKKKSQKVVDQKKQQEYVKSEPVVKSTPSSTSKYSNKVSGWRWPVAGKITKGYSSQLHGNKGIDIAGKLGTKVHASAAGKVVYAGNALRGYGNLVIIKHNEDYLSAYAHNNKILVKEKELISKGQVIGEMGQTDSETVKLHFEIRYRGKSVNPLKYLPKR